MMRGSRLLLHWVTEKVSHELVIFCWSGREVLRRRIWRGNTRSRRRKRRSGCDAVRLRNPWLDDRRF